jgi:hypothetical protein
MAGTFVSDTIQDGAGNSTSTTNLVKAPCVAWVKYNGVAQTIGASYNVSSVTYSATGQYVVNFTNALSDTNYCAVLGAGYTSAGSTDFHYCVNNGTYSTTQLGIYYLTSSGGAFANTAIFNVAIHR